MEIDVKNYGEIKSEQRKTAIVLSGGGTRGSYQAGVLKAAMEYGFFPDIVTGTSIGALNGVIYVQKTKELFDYIYENMSPELVFGKGLNPKMDLGKFGNFFARWIVDQGMVKPLGFQSDKSGKLRDLGESVGTMPAGLEGIVYGNLLEKTVRESDIEFAINTTEVYNPEEGFTGFRKNTLTKDEIPEGKMADYLLASANLFPLFAPKKIDDGFYIDGGASENIPIVKALEMGANDIIVVRVFGELFPGRERRNLNIVSKSNDVRVLTLNPDCNIGSMASFDSKITKFGLQKGYEEGIKFFNEYQKMINFENKTRKI